jgi:ABC-type antimicrobial peptide transport system permease subunit
MEELRPTPVSILTPVRVLIIRRRSLVAFVWLSLGVGLAVGLAAFALVRIESIWPVSFRALMRPEAIPDTVWSARWSAALATPFRIQSDGLAALLGVLLAIAGVTALLALLNAISMMAGQRVLRRREFAIRAAVGAGTRRLMAEKGIEAGFLYGGGLLLAQLFAVLILVLIRASWPDGLEAAEGPGSGALMPAALAAFSLAVLAATARTRAADLRAMLAGGSATADARSRRDHSIPIVIATMLALALSSTAALLLRHGRFEQSESSILVKDVATVDITASASTARERAATYAMLLDSAHQLKGVHAESLASPGAWLGMGMRDQIMVECGQCYAGGMYLPIQSATVVHHAVSPGFFEAMDVPVLAGRSFDRSDSFDTVRVALVNETFARTSFEAGNPIGRSIRLGGFNGEWYTIIGVVRDIAGRGLGASPVVAALYVATTQQPPVTVGLAVQTAEERTAITRAFRAVTRDLPVELVDDATSMERRLDRAVAPLRWFGFLFAIFAAVAVALAFYGVNALVRAHVEGRRKELAIRAAVGATPRRLLLLVLSDTSRIALTGLALGAIAAWSAGRALQSEIGGLPSIELGTTLVLAVGILMAALTGALAPATNAGTTSPAALLRQE